MKAFHVIIGAGVVGAAIGSAAAFMSVAGPAPLSLDDLAPAAGPGVDTTAAKAVCPEPTFDFGVMQRGAKMRHEFVIRNEGQATLRLTAGRPSCKCTAFEVAADLVPAGESVNIGLEWVAKANPGPFRQTAPVNTNDPLRPVVELSIEGTVVEPTGLYPSSFEFGEVRAGEPASTSIIYFSTDDTPIELEAAPPSRPEAEGLFEVKVEPVDLAEIPHPNATDGRRITLTASGELPTGQIMEWVKLNANRENTEELEVPVVGRVTGDITLHGGKWNEEAGVLNFGMVASGDGAKSRVLLSVKGEHAADTRFEVVSTDPPELQVNIGETKARSDSVHHTYMTVEVPKGTRPMVRLNTAQGEDGVIRLKTTHPKSPEVVVRVRFAVTG